MDGSWWRHQMEIFSALLAICAGNSPVPGEFPTQRPVTRSFDAFFDRRLNKRLSKQSWAWWFETPSRPLWRHCNVNGAVRFPFDGVARIILSMGSANERRCYIVKSSLIGQAPTQNDIWGWHTNKFTRLSVYRYPSKHDIVHRSTSHTAECNFRCSQWRTFRRNDDILFKCVTGWGTSRHKSLWIKLHLIKFSHDFCRWIVEVAGIIHLIVTIQDKLSMTLYIYIIFIASASFTSTFGFAPDSHLWNPTKNKAHYDVTQWKAFRVTGPLWGKSTGYQWLPLTKAPQRGLQQIIENFRGDLRRHDAILTSLWYPGPTHPNQQS